MSERSHVLVLGARGGSNGTCPEQFVRRLLGLDDEPDPSKAAAAPQQQGPFHWAIATKYYRAELAVHVRHAEPGAASASSLEAAVSLEGPAADGQEGEGEGPHGVILVVDGRQAAELEAWRPWLEAVAERGPELCLCVGMVPLDEEGVEAAREELVRERTLWCLESGFEYVEVDTCVSGGSMEAAQQQQRRRLPAELRETEGMERVRESIEATPWPTLVRLPRGGVQEEGGGGGDRKNTAASIGKSVEAAAEGQAAGLGKGGEGGQQPSSVEAEAEAAPEAPAAAASEWAGLEAGTTNDDLEALFDRIRAIRESARQGGGTRAGAAGTAGAGSDEERRARAAGAALELARLLGLGEKEDEEDEDSDVESRK